MSLKWRSMKSLMKNMQRDQVSFDISMFLLGNYKNIIPVVSGYIIRVC